MILTLAVRALATWRLSHLFMYEEGPYLVLLRVRVLAGVRHDPDTGTPIAYPDGSVFACFLCFSMWVAFVTTLLPEWLLRPFALSAAAIWIEKVAFRGTR